MRHLLFPALLLVFVPVTLFFSFYLLTTISADEEVAAREIPPVQIFSALPATYPTLSISLEEKDARVLLIKNYLKQYDSPLVPYAAKLVGEADRDGIDFRLLTAIARQESNLCKYAPPDTYNCWGWGIHKAGTLGFENYDQAIEVVSLGIKEKYIDKGLTTPEEIMTKYTPSSNGSWANGVSSFLDDIK